MTKTLDRIMDCPSEYCEGFTYRKRKFTDNDIKKIHRLMRRVFNFNLRTAKKTVGELMDRTYEECKRTEDWTLYNQMWNCLDEHKI